MQITAVDWMFDDSTSSSDLGNRSANSNIVDYLRNREIDLVINLPLRAHQMSSSNTHGYRIRQLCVEHRIPLITDVKCAKMLCRVSKLAVKCLNIFPISAHCVPCFFVARQ